MTNINKTKLPEQASEMVEIYNDMLEPIGLAERGVANLNGLWHFCSQCWIIRSSSENSSVVFQMRSNKKSVAPGLLDVSASGHISAGNSSKHTAIEEVKEELGIDIYEKGLISLGRRIDLFQKGSVLSRIFADVYFYQDNTSLDNYILDPTELDGIIEISLSSGENLFSGKEDKIVCSGLFYDSNTKLFNHKEIEVKIDQFIHRYDRYYLKVFMMAKELLNGNNTLSI